jgi:hypothetical protein
VPATTAFKTLRRMLAAIRIFWRQLVARWIFGYSFFVCHAAENAPYAERVRVELEQNGLRTFIDERSLFTLGADGTINDRLLKAIHRSGVLLVVDTPAARQKLFPAVEIKAALAANCAIVRIEQQGNREPWVHLDADAKAAVENSTRYLEVPAEILRGRPSRDVIAKVATHLNWRRYWPVVHHSVATTIVAGIVIAATLWHTSRVADALRGSPMPASAAHDAAHLFGVLAPLFEHVSPAMMSDIRTALLATYARELEFTPNRQSGAPGDCPGQEGRDAGPLPADALLRLTAADPDAIRWRVDPTARYALSAGGPSGRSNIWDVSTAAGGQVATSAVEWLNADRTTCASLFTPDGAVLLLAQRNGMRAELQLVAVPSGWPIGDSIVLKGKLPLSLEANGGLVSVVTDAGTSRLAMTPRPSAWTAPLDRFPHSGRMGTGERLALTFGIAPEMDLCHRESQGLHCDNVWSGTLQRDSNDQAEIDAFDDAGQGAPRLTFHTMRSRVTCDARESGRWDCKEDAITSTPFAEAEGFVRTSPDWTINVVKSQPTESVAVISRRGLWVRPHCVLRRAGRIIDASMVHDDVLRLLTWTRGSVVVEDVPLSAPSFRERATAGTAQ